jgi:CDP-diacylglycerol pyrophosphatase
MKAKFLLLVSAWSLGLCTSEAIYAVEKSDILLEIATQCVRPVTGEYCSRCIAPRVDSGCSGSSECKKTTEVWALNDRFTVIRDVKMCGCPAAFVHGLALPVYPVTGVEDPSRPKEIWQFAWDVAVQKMEPDSIALVVNPRQKRSQNQLHVHLLRLKSDARSLFENAQITHVTELEQVWQGAEKVALSNGFTDYGVLVARHSGHDFIVVVVQESPEDMFTVQRCL